MTVIALGCSQELPTRRLPWHDPPCAGVPGGDAAPGAAATSDDDPGGPRRARPAKDRGGPVEVDGRALVRLLTGMGAEAELVDVPLNRPPWTSTTIQAGVGDQITWLSSGQVDLIKPLGVAVGPGMGLLCRVRDGKPRDSARATMTFTAERTGPVEVAGRFPGWVLENGSIATDRVPYRQPYRTITGD